MRPNFELKNARIEAVTPRDAAKLLRFIKAYYRFDRIPFDRKVLTSSLSLLLNGPIFGGAWFILNGSKPVGYLILTFGFDLEFGGRQATLTDLYIETPYRRRGIGGAILAQVEEFCRS